MHRCLDEGIPLPIFSQTWWRQLYKEVSTVSRAQKQDTDDPELTETESDMPFERPSRSGLAQMLSAEANGFKTIIHLNITEHFKKRLYKFVRWTFHTSEERVMPPEEYKSHKLAMLQITNDLLRVENATLGLVPSLDQPVSIFLSSRCFAAGWPLWSSGKSITSTSSTGNANDESGIHLKAVESIHSLWCRWRASSVLALSL